MSQRTLSRTIPALLPTPQAADGERGPDYARQRERVETHGSGGDDLTTTVAKLLPTPTAEEERQSKDATYARGNPTLSSVGRLLPTPQAADGDGGRQEKGAMGEGGGKRPSGQKATLPLPTAVAMRETISETPFAATVEPGEQASLFDATEPLLARDLPTPRAHEGSNRRRKPTPAMLRGEAGLDLAAAASLLPTPVANPQNSGAGGELRAAIVHGEGRRNETGVDTLGRPNRGRAGAEEPDHLLPTPLVTSDRNSRKSMVENRQWSAPSLAQAAEIAAGILPREFESWDEVPGELGRKSRELLPTQDGGENTAGPSQRERNSEALNVVAAKLLPTPTGTEDGRKSDRALRARGEGGMGSPPGLGQTIRESVGTEVSWGVYEGAVRRWEAIFGRDAPPPTDEKGRLAPEFVEWMLGYPEGWFDVEKMKRTAKLRALGNSVQVQCAEVVGDWAAALIRSGLLLRPYSARVRPGAALR